MTSRDEVSGFLHPHSSMRVCHAAGPGSIPGRDKFPGWGFFRDFSTPVRQMSGSFRPPRSSNIIWPSLSSIIIHYGGQWPEMLKRLKSSNIHTYMHPHVGNKNRAQVQELHTYRQILELGSIIVVYMQVQHTHLRHETTPLLVNKITVLKLTDNTHQMFFFLAVFSFHHLLLITPHRATIIDPSII